MISLDEGPEEFLELIPKFIAVHKSATNQDLYILIDKKVAALDQSLSELNLIDRQEAVSEKKFKKLNAIKVPV